MKKIIRLVIVLLIIAAALYWFFVRQDDVYQLEEAIVFAEQGECAGYGTMTHGEYYEDWNYWYIDIDLPESNDPEDNLYVLSCEVNMSTGESRLIVDKAINWFESDFVEEVLEEDVEPDPIIQVEEDVEVPVQDPVVEVDGALTLEEAQLLAASSECLEKGNLSGQGDSYNDITKTWWLGLEMLPEFENDFCNPACVISDSDLSAEINWRCTGALEPVE